MDIKNILSLISGLCLFLFGMNIMGQALERKAGNKLKSILNKMTTNKILGLLTGIGITAIIQSSSATTVMVVGFVNSGLMTLKQAINVIMGANIGTTVTSWILSLGGIESDNFFVSLLKPSFFTPILALIGIYLYLFNKKDKHKDIGLVLLGFSTLMFGMETMSSAVSGLSQIPEFQNILIAFKNPILGVIAGTILTAIIQSSSASVGILQALATTGSISFEMAIPIIMGQNIGTCATALISSVGTNKNAKRASLVHLTFNIMGTVICLILFCIFKVVFAPKILTESVNMYSIAIIHTVFNVFCTLILFPFSSILEKIVLTIIPKAEEEKEETIELDERLLVTPSIALNRCNELTLKMANLTKNTLMSALLLVESYNESKIEQIEKEENKIDEYEDKIGTYLIKLNSKQMSLKESTQTAKLFRLIGDFERISDYSLLAAEKIKYINDKNLNISDEGRKELQIISKALTECMENTIIAFNNNDIEKALSIEPLHKVIQNNINIMKKNHIQRRIENNCKIELEFIWEDILNYFFRIAAHLSNIGGCIIDTANESANIHTVLRDFRHNSENYNRLYEKYMQKYGIE